MDSSLSQALHSAIGANTRVFLARVVAIDHVDRGRVTAFSEFLGNLEVVVGNLQWLRIDDWIFVSRASSEEKYQPYLYLGWAGNQQNITPGSPTLYNADAVTLVTDLPSYRSGARIGEIRLVGGTVDLLTGLTTGGTLYMFVDVNGLQQWIQFGSSGGSAQRSFGWFIPGVVTAGMMQGPVYRADAAMTITGVSVHAKVDSTLAAQLDIRVGALSTYVSIFSATQPITTTTLLTPTSAAIAAGQFVVLDIVSYAGAELTDLTVQVYLGLV